MKVRRMILPGTIAAAAVTALVGCIYIPGSFKRSDGLPRPENLIAKDSTRRENRPLAVGVSTRAEVVKVLGMPNVESHAPDTLIWSYEVDAGGWWFICGYAIPDVGVRYLVTRYDDSGVLRALRVTKDPRDRP